MNSATQFTPYGWVTLGIFTGVAGAVANVLFKKAARDMQPYVVMLFVGAGWLIPSLPFLSGNGGGAGSLSLDVWAILGVVGCFWWLDNLARFDAFNKAPYAAYVIMAIELSAAVTLFVLEPVVKVFRGQAVSVNAYQLCGTGTALLAFVLFQYGSLAHSKPTELARGVKYFTRFGWVPLAIFAGVMSGVGNLVIKGMEQPPYVTTGLIGLVWTALSMLYITVGSGWKRVSLPPATTWSEMVRLNWLLPLAAVAGVITWVENLSRFDALGKAPLAGYLMLMISVVGLSALFVFEVVLKLRRGEALSMTKWEVGGCASSVLAIVLFKLGG